MQLGERHAYGQTDEAERGKCERGEKRRGTRTTRTAGTNKKCTFTQRATERGRCMVMCRGGASRRRRPHRGGCGRRGRCSGADTTARPGGGRRRRGRGTGSATSSKLFLLGAHNFLLHGWRRTQHNRHEKVSQPAHWQKRERERERAREHPTKTP
jgi:hypothetical protein